MLEPPSEGWCPHLGGNPGSATGKSSDLGIIHVWSFGEKLNIFEKQSCLYSILLSINLDL